MTSGQGVAAPRSGAASGSGSGAAAETDPTRQSRQSRQSEARPHWDRAYERCGVDGVTWFQSQPTMSLRVLDELGVPRDATLIDVGGGASLLVDHLLTAGWRDVSVLDVSPVAVGAAESRVGDSPVSWIIDDVLRWEPRRRYDVWHDRALFHFLTDEEQRVRYADRLRQAVRPGGWVVAAAHGPDAPPTSSGLPVVRYDSESLAVALGPDLELMAVHREEHRTPYGGLRPYTWVGLRVRGSHEDLDSYVGAAREGLDRVAPERLEDEQAGGAVVVDIRPTEQRLRDGELPGAVVVDRNVLEWRMVTTSPYRLSEADQPDRHIIVVCNQGYASSVAAATLRRLGMTRATDLAGGFQAWLRFLRQAASRLPDIR